SDSKFMTLGLIVKHHYRSRLLVLQNFLARRFAATVTTWPARGQACPTGMSARRFVPGCQHLESPQKGGKILSSFTPDTGYRKRLSLDDPRNRGWNLAMHQKAFRPASRRVRKGLPLIATRQA